MARIFVSYSRSDQTFARQLATSLAEFGADVWIDVDDIPVGLKWSRAIQEGLDRSDVLVVIISPDSMTSSNVEDEWQYFLDQRKPVIPVLLHPAKVHFQLSRIQYVDFDKQGYPLALRQLHTVLEQKGLALKPLEGSKSGAVLVEQSPLPIQETEEAAAPTGESRRSGLLVMAGFVTIAVFIVLLIINAATPPSPSVAQNPTTTTPGTTAAKEATTRAVTPTATSTRTATRTPTPTLTLTSTSTITLTPTPVPSATPSLSATDIEGTVQGEIAAIPVQDAQTQAAFQTATATFWTPTPTFDVRATARARITETYQAAVEQATATLYAQQTQAILDQTATATLWTPTPSVTPSPTLTPTPLGGGGQIAFESTGGGNNDDIDVIGVDGQNLTTLTNDPANDLYPAWSPDGKQIAFSSNRQGGNRDLYVMDADGSNVTRLTFNADFEEDPAWSPDGKQIAFSSSFGTSTRDLWVINADGSNLRQLTDNPAEDRKATWSPDGTKIAFHSDRKDSGYFQIYVLKATCATTKDCEASVQPVENAYGTFPSWSPDGKQILFQSNIDKNYNIYVINADGGSPQRLTADSSDDRRPAWSPDGTKIVFQSDRDGDIELYIMGAQGDHITQLTNNTWDDTDPVWRPG